MTRPDPADRRLAQLRQFRTRPERDLSLAFIDKQFKRQVERPYKQLAAVVELWQSLVGPELAAHTRLESLARGVLRVAVDSSPRLYELDRLLRQGLERRLITEHKGGTLRKVQLKVGAMGPENEPGA